MFKWKFSLLAFLLGSEVNELIDSAIKGQSLTYQGVTLVLIGVLIALMVWFAKTQFSKEAVLTERLVKLAQESNQVIRENTKVGDALTANVDALTDEIRELKKSQQDDRVERARRTRGAQ